MTRLSPGLVFAVVALTALLYWPGLHGGFVFDDFPNLVMNHALRASNLTLDALWQAALSSDAGPLARPLTMLTFALQIAWSGESIFALKLGNLVIHLASGVVVFLIARRILSVWCSQGGWSAREVFFAPAIAAAWLVAPINLTVVLYVVQRMESLSGFFVLLALLGYLHGRAKWIRGENQGFFWMVASLTLGTLLAALAKETGVLVPAYALVLEWGLYGLRDPASQALERKILFLFGATLLLPGVAGLAATFPAAASGAAYADRTFTLAERLLTEPRILMDYLRWILIPDLQEMSLYHDDYAVSRGWLSPPSTLFSVLGVCGLVAVAVWLRKRRPLVSIGIGFFLVGHSLVSTYLPLELAFEHRNYLPSLGVILAAFDVLLLGASRRAYQICGLAVAVGLLCLNALFLHLRAKEWEAPVRLALIEASRHPHSVRANYEMGRVFGEQVSDPNSPGYSIAMSAFDVAARLPDAGLLPIQAKIYMAAKFGQPVQGESWSEMKAAVGRAHLSSQDVVAIHALIACVRSGPCQGGKNALEEVLVATVASHPGRPDVLTQYADFLIHVAQSPSQGLEIMQRAVALAPQNPQYWANLIGLQIALGLADDALHGIKRLKELDRLRTWSGRIASLEARMNQPAGS